MRTTFSRMHTTWRNGAENTRSNRAWRAVSTAYYAAFHLLVADSVANWRIPDQRSRLGRMLEHRRMSGAVFEIGKKSNPTPIEADIRAPIIKFGQLQRDRNDADYNVAMIWSLTDVVRSLKLADEVFTIWRRIRKEDLAQHHLMSMFGARPN